MEKVFDETILLADIVREFGVHAEVFAALIKERNLYKATLEDYANPANWEERHVHADISASDVWMHGDDLDGFEYAANTLAIAQPAPEVEA